MPIFLRSLDVSFVVINKLPERVRKSIQGLVCPKLTAQVSVLELFLTHQMTILLIGCKPNNFESHKYLELSFTNIQGLHLNFTEYESLPPPPTLTFLFRWNSFGWLKWFWQFLCEGSSSFNPTGFCYSFSQTCSLYEGRVPFYTEFISGHSMPRFPRTSKLKLFNT